MRSFITELAKARPGDLKMVTDQVDPKFEVTAIAEKLEDQGSIPAIIYKNIKGSKLPLIISLAATYERLAFAMGTTVEKMVEVIRFHYESLYFIVPSSAMSAGTIFCMAGDKIFMDYSSSLGPIDPQIHNGERWVPALGYIDKINELITKSEQGILTDAEFAMLQKLDLGTIRAYEQAKDLSIDLLKKWLVKYKFKSWTIHRTTIDKIGQPVTEEEKEMRAKKIAQMLSDNNIWHSHGRFIGIETLKDLLKLEIDDYTSEANLRNCIITYNSLLQEFVAKNNRRVFFHTNLGE